MGYRETRFFVISRICENMDLWCFVLRKAMLNELFLDIMAVSSIILVRFNWLKSILVMSK